MAGAAATRARAPAHESACRACSWQSPGVDRLPLTGFRIVDLTVDRGELCARLLADLGADAVKVESPPGSPARSLAPHHGDLGLFWAMRNAGKRGVALDLSNDS